MRGKGVRHSWALALAGGVPPRCARLPPSPCSPCKRSSARIQPNAVERDGHDANKPTLNTPRLATAAGAAKSQGWHQRSPLRATARAVLPGIDTCGYRRRSAMLQRSSGVASCAPFSARK